MERSADVLVASYSTPWGMGVVSVSRGRLLGVELPSPARSPLALGCGRRLRGGRHETDRGRHASRRRGRRAVAELGLGSGGLLPGRAAGLEGEGSASGGDGSGRFRAAGVSSSAVGASGGHSQLRHPGRVGGLSPGGAGGGQCHGRQSHPCGDPLPPGGALGWESGQLRQGPGLEAAPAGARGGSRARERRE